MNNEVLTELYDKYSAKVFNTANCIVKDEEAASDIMQEVFITVWQKYETLREKGKVGAWITTITVNKCKEYLRKAKKDAVYFGDVLDDADSNFEEMIADEDRTVIPEESVMDKQIKEMLASLINELPEKQRICMLMYYGYDRKISEIAETLEIPESTVKSCLNYGKKKLAAKVAELEKKGYVLRSTTITVLPFLIRYLLEEEPSKKIPVSFILRSAKAAAKTGAVIAEGAAAEGAASAAGASGAVTAEGAAASAAASTAGTAAESAASAATAAAGGGVKAAGKAASALIRSQARSLPFKIVSGITAATVLAGGGALAGSKITEKRLTQNPPYAAVGERLSDNKNPISVDGEPNTNNSEAPSESTTNIAESTTGESGGFFSRLFGNKTPETDAQTSGTVPKSEAPSQSSTAESKKQPTTEAAQTENKKTTVQKQPTTKQNAAEEPTTEPHTTEPHTTEPHTTEPHTTEPHTAAPTETTEFIFQDPGGGLKHTMDPSEDEGWL